MLLKRSYNCCLRCVQQLSHLKQRLAEAEAERDKLLEELKRSHVIGASDSEDMDEMLDFPGTQSFHRSHTSISVPAVPLLHASASAVM